MKMTNKKRGYPLSGKGGAFLLLALLLLTAIGCGPHPDFKETAFVDFGGPYTEIETLEETLPGESLTEAAPETQSQTDAPTAEETDGLRVIYLDNDRDGVNEIKLVGRLDVIAAKEAEAAFAAAAEEAKDVVLDLSELDYIASAGLRALKRLRGDLRDKGCDLTLRGVQDDVMDVLELTGFAAMLTFE